MPTEVPSCDHGPRIFREGDGPKGHWTAHFCSEPKGSPQCAPIWGKKDAPTAPSQAPSGPSEATLLLQSIDSKLAVVVELLRDLSTRDIKF